MEKMIKKNKKLKTYASNESKTVRGEYHNLFPDIKTYPDKFKKYMRMSLITFQYILQKVERFLEKKWCNFHQHPILPEERLVLTIRFLATGMSYNDLSFSFGIAISTICAAVKEVMDILWNQLYPIHMPVPTKTQLLENSEDFFIKWDFPHCLGAIDCKHIRIKQPARSGSLYFNYKKFYSVVLQAVVDSKYKFISIDVGGFGSQHDAVTLRASSFYKAVQNGLVKLPEADELPNSKIILPYFFIGDGAYPLMESLLKPYPGNKLSKDELIFNKRLSRARMAVECTFGQICQRWKIFYTTIQQEPKIVNIITKCACILHNVIIDMEGENSSNIIDEILDTNTSEEIDHTEDTNFTAGCGKELRDEIKIFVNQNPTSANKNIIKN